MARTKSGQWLTITIDPTNTTSPASPNPATPKGPNANLKFVLAKGYIWIPPYVTFSGAPGDFGTPTVGPNGNVNVTDTNGDSDLCNYTVYFQNAATGAREKLTIDPEIQNSNDN